MKKIDPFGLKLCSYQAALFEASVRAAECSSAVFIRRFMNSDLAKRMDKPGFLFESLDVKAAIGEAEAQYGASSCGTEKYSPEEMHRIGSLYRYWAYTAERSGRQCCKTVKPGMLRKLFFPYHSPDPAQAVERITEALGPAPERDMTSIAAGAEVLRRARGKRNGGR